VEGEEVQPHDVQRPPSRLALWLTVAGLIGSAVWGLFAYQDLQHRLSELSRTTVPGGVVVDVQEPHTLTVFYEDTSSDGVFVVQSSGTTTLERSPIEMIVTGPSGEIVQTSPYERDLRFTHDGRTVTALSTFIADTPGSYVIDVSGTVPSTARVGVGDVVGPGLVANGGGAIALFVGSLLAALVMGVIAAIRRGRAGPPQKGARTSEPAPEPASRH
jgi:hypothetical protein